MHFTFPMETIHNGTLVGSINGTIIGGAELLKGKNGLALYTNGVNQYVDFGYQGDTCLGYFIGCTHGWVTALWVKRESSLRTSVIMDTGLRANRGVWIYWSRGGLLLAHFASGQGDSIVRAIVNHEQVWLHVVATWQSYYGTKLFVNGKLMATDDTELSMPNNQSIVTRSFVVGASSSYDRKFEGSVDELRVWDTVISQEDVLALYAADARCIWLHRGSWEYFGYRLTHWGRVTHICVSETNHQSFR